MSIDAVRQRFIARCADDLDALRRADLGGGMDDELRQRVHRLAGLAGSLGLDSLGEAAKMLDDALYAGEPDFHLQLDALLGALESVAGGH